MPVSRTAGFLASAARSYDLAGRREALARDGHPGADGAGVEQLDHVWTEHADAAFQDNLADQPRRVCPVNA